MSFFPDIDRQLSTLSANINGLVETQKTIGRDVQSILTDRARLIRIDSDLRALRTGVQAVSRKGDKILELLKQLTEPYVDIEVGIPQDRKV